jgi:SAM-dependent methyltransferase
MDYFVSRSQPVVAAESGDVSTEVFEHIYHHPLGYLRECWRVLRRGGLLLLSTPNPTTFANAVRLALGKEISWGSMAFAETPKLSPEGMPLAVWDIHFREYTQAILSDIVGKLEGAEVLEKGFLAKRAEFGGDGVQTTCHLDRERRE